MAGTSAGGKAAAQTNRQKYGNDFYGIIGAKGGSKRVSKGFATMTPEKRKEYGSKGGKISKRGPKK